VSFVAPPTTARTSAASDTSAETNGKLFPAPRTVEMPRISEPMMNASTPPAVAASCA
jgi:hypothetical protein